MLFPTNGRITLKIEKSLNGCKTGYIKINNKQCFSLFSVGGVNEPVNHQITFLLAEGVAQS